MKVTANNETFNDQFTPADIRTPKRGEVFTLDYSGEPTRYHVIDWYELGDDYRVILRYQDLLGTVKTKEINFSQVLQEMAESN